MLDWIEWRFCECLPTHACWCLRQQMCAYTWHHYHGLGFPCWTSKIPWEMNLKHGTFAALGQGFGQERERGLLSWLWANMEPLFMWRHKPPLWRHTLGHLIIGGWEDTAHMVAGKLIIYGLEFSVLISDCLPRQHARTFNPSLSVHPPHEEHFIP